MMHRDRRKGLAGCATSIHLPVRLVAVSLTSRLECPFRPVLAMTICRGSGSGRLVSLRLKSFTGEAEVKSLTNTVVRYEGFYVLS